MPKDSDTPTRRGKACGRSPTPRHPDTSFLSYGRQCIDDSDIAAVVSALKSDFLTTGPCVEAFEKALAEYCGAKHAIALANGTAALHVAMLAAGVKQGQRVLTSANTFLASANSAEFVGATADFADIDPGTYNVSADSLRAAWKDDVRAVVPVDFAGQPCDMPAIAKLAHEKGAIIIEDASHALGSRFMHRGKWYKVGGHPWADMTTFSFHPVKTITTGEGGAILTDNDELAERCRL
jgi:dTDP-4-amino-4,6-dideoxygalactose transaminase